MGGRKQFPVFNEVYSSVYPHGIYINLMQNTTAVIVPYAMSQDWCIGIYKCHINNMCIDNINLCLKLFM